jgi:hypothetical protein
MDYVIFALYQKSFELDVISGNITKTDLKRAMPFKTLVWGGNPPKNIK